jgi:hypothetical protein
MKKILPVLLIVSALIFVFDNDFEITAPWKDIPVVYGLLDRSDSLQILRVEKAFLDPTTSALEIAQNPDSLYYDNATVEVENLRTGNVYAFDQINGEDINLFRDPGIFAESPNILYSGLIPINDLEPEDILRFTLVRNENLPAVTAETTVLEDARITRPNELGEMRFREDEFTKVVMGLNETASLADLVLRLNYFEEDASGNFEIKSIIWKWAQGVDVVDGMVTTFQVDGQEFYQILADEIDTNPGFRRIFQDIDIILTTGGEEIKTYFQVINANSGITSTGEIPSFTNLTEGFGLISSTNRVERKGVPISGETRGDLKTNPTTSDFNWQ